MHKVRARRTMDGAIDTSSAQQRGIGCVDDRVDRQCRDVGAKRSVG